MDNLSSILLLGIKNSVSFSTLLIFLIFVLYLYFISQTITRILCAGFFFILSAMVFNLFLISGGFDPFLLLPEVSIVLRLGSLMLGGIFLCVGGSCFGAWFRIRIKKINGEEDMRYCPLFFAPRSAPSEKTDEKPFKPLASLLDFVFVAVFSVFLGLMATGAGSLMSEDYFLFLAFENFFFLNGKAALMEGAVLYSVACFSLLLILWILVVLGGLHARMRRFFLGNVARIKLLFSSFYLAGAFKLITDFFSR